jgi:hypothetical protein
MTDLDLFDPEHDPNAAAEAMRLRDEGMARSANHAEAVTPGWKDLAFLIFCDYARTHPTFTTEHVRLHAMAAGLIEEPPDNRAWGSIAARARRAGITHFLGYGPSSDPKQHRSPAAIWGVGPKGTP